MYDRMAGEEPRHVVTERRWSPSRKQHISRPRDVLDRSNSDRYVIVTVYVTHSCSTGGLVQNESEKKLRARQDNARELIRALRGSAWKKKQLPSGRQLSKKQKKSGLVPEIDVSVEAAPH